MMNKICKVVFSLLFFVLLTSCVPTEKSDKLTVSNIHNNVISKKTTVEELVEMYGKPYTIVKDSQEAIDVFERINGDEGSVSYSLELNTDYWETVRVDKESALGINFDAYYEYRGDNLGLERVYFFVTDGTVRLYRFDGDIIDESVAKKDKYLSQILD